MILTTTQMDRLSKQASAYLDAAYADDPAQRREIADLLAEIYIAELENKTPEQGRLMAEALLEDVHSFMADYETSRRSGAGICIDRIQTSMEAGMDDAERSTLWMKCAAGASAVGAEMTGPSAQHRDLLIELDSLYIPRQAASKELADTLRTHAHAAMLDTGTLLLDAGSCAQDIASLAQHSGETRLYTSAGDKEAYYALIAMLAYVGAKKGEYANIPADIRLEQTAALTCAGMERLCIADQAASNKLTDEAQKNSTVELGILGSLTSARLFQGASAGTFFGLLTLAPACLSLIAAIGFGLSAGVNAWTKEHNEKTPSLHAVDTKRTASALATLAIKIRGLLPALSAQAKEIFTRSLGRVFAGSKQPATKDTAKTSTKSVHTTTAHKTKVPLK